MLTQKELDQKLQRVEARHAAMNASKEWTTQQLHEQEKKEALKAAQYAALRDLDAMPLRRGSSLVLFATPVAPPQRAHRTGETKAREASSTFPHSTEPARAHSPGERSRWYCELTDTGFVPVGRPGSPPRQGTPVWAKSRRSQEPHPVVRSTRVRPATSPHKSSPRQSRYIAGSPGSVTSRPQTSPSQPRSANHRGGAGGRSRSGLRWNAHGTARLHHKAEWKKRFNYDLAGGILRGELDQGDVARYRRHTAPAPPQAALIGLAGTRPSRASSKMSEGSSRVGSQTVRHSGWWEDGGLDRDRGESRHGWEEDLALELGASVTSEDWRHRLLFNEPLQSRLLSHQ